MKGFKVFSSNWTCRGFKYEVGKTYKMDKAPILCKRGFHFCEKPASCFNYYDFDCNNKVAEIEAIGQIHSGGDKSCTNKIKILREIPWREVLDLVNEGKNCAGLKNTGDWNTGNYNTGRTNAGHNNTGNYNIGSYNTGDWNIGSCNTGKGNIGYYNAGDRNSGDGNTGDRNSGNGNVGDWNAGDFSYGCFNENTEEDKIRLFNEPSDWSLKDWKESEAYLIMRDSPSDIVIWKSWDRMNEEEKKEYPEAQITGGCLIRRKADMQKWWDSLSKGDQYIIMGLPNFNPDIFKKCTGITIKRNINSKNKD